MGGIVEEFAVWVEGGETDAGAVGTDDLGAGFGTCGGDEETFFAGAGVAVEEEDGGAGRVAADGVAEGVAVGEGHSEVFLMADLGDFG